MKYLIVGSAILALIIGSVYYGASENPETKTMTREVKQEARQVSQPPVLERVIEKTYVREVYVREVVHHEPEPKKVTVEGDPDKCNVFTGIAKDNCFKYIRKAGNQCDAFQNNTNFYPCLKQYGGGA